MTDKPLNILVVEDDEALQNVYVMILSSQGYRVRAASNGVLAFNELSKEAPDLILLDYFMPVMDGKTFLMNFDPDVYPNTKIVVATNISDKSILDELISLGAHSYILKSKFSPNQIVDMVQTVTAG